MFWPNIAHIFKMVDTIFYWPSSFCVKCIKKNDIHIELKPLTSKEKSSNTTVVYILKISTSGVLGWIFRVRKLRRLHHGNAGVAAGGGGDNQVQRRHLGPSGEGEEEEHELADDGAAEEEQNDKRKGRQRHWFRLNLFIFSSYETPKNFIKYIIFNLV